MYYLGLKHDEKVNETKHHRMITDAVSKRTIFGHFGIENISHDIGKWKRLNNLPSSPLMSAYTLFGSKQVFVAFMIKWVMLKIVENEKSFLEINDRCKLIMIDV